jgi:hypothetical protein
VDHHPAEFEIFIAAVPTWLRKRKIPKKAMTEKRVFDNLFISFSSHLEYPPHDA